MPEQDVEALAKRLETPIWTEAVMKRWDYVRRMIANGHTSSHPRDVVEADLDGWDEDRREAAATLRAQAAEIARLRGELADGSFYKESDIDALQARAEKAEAAARTAYARGLEDAAKVADKLNGWGPDCGSGGHAEHIAAAIRALAPDPEGSAE